MRWPVNAPSLPVLLLAVSILYSSLCIVVAASPPATSPAPQPWWRRWGSAVRSRFFPRQLPTYGARFQFPTATTAPWFDVEGRHSFLLHLPEAKGHLGQLESVSVELYTRRWLGRSALLGKMETTVAELKKGRLINFNFEHLQPAYHDRTVYLEAYLEPKKDLQRRRYKLATSESFPLVHVGLMKNSVKQEFPDGIESPRPFRLELSLGSSFTNWRAGTILVATLVDGSNNQPTKTELSFAVDDIETGTGKISLTVPFNRNEGWYYLRVYREGLLRKSLIYQSSPVLLASNGHHWSRESIQLYPTPDTAGLAHLAAAIDCSSVSWARSLLAMGIPVDTGGGIGAKIAVRHADSAILTLLGDSGAFEEGRDVWPDLLSDCVVNGQLKLLQQLVKLLQPEVDSKQVRNAFVYAVRLNQLSMVLWFLQSQLLFDLNFESGIALRSATANGYVDMARLLLDTGRVDIHVNEDQAYMNAVSLADARMFTMLIDFKAPKELDQLVMLTARNDKDYYLSKLLKLEAAIVETGGGKSTITSLLENAMRSAIRAGSIKSVRHIYSVFPSIVNVKNGFAVREAVFYNQLNILEFLMARQACLGEGAEVVVLASRLNRINMLPLFAPQLKLISMLNARMHVMKTLLDRKLYRAFIVLARECQLAQSELRILYKYGRANGGNLTYSRVMGKEFGVEAAASEFDAATTSRKRKSDLSNAEDDGAVRQQGRGLEQFRAFFAYFGELLKNPDLEYPNFEERMFMTEDELQARIDEAMALLGGMDIN